jgi:hypothetical protein
MNTQDQINHCIAHLNQIGEGVSRIEICQDKSISPRSDSRDARVYSAKNPTVYYTIWSIFSDEQIESMEIDDMEQRVDQHLENEERIANEVYQSMEDDRVAREYGPNY